MNKSKFIVVMVAVVAGLGCFGDDVKGRFPEEDVVMIKAFFEEFKEALNSNDVERVRRLSGGAWGHFSTRINCGDIVEEIDIIDVSMSNVVTKTSVRDVNGDLRRAEVVFIMKKVDGLYTVEKMLLPESDRRRNEFKEALNAIKRLEVAINSRDADAVRREVSFSAVKDFNKELSRRGLQWIGDALNCGDGAMASGAGVSRENEGVIIGRINVPSPDGSKILQEVYFSGSKIDRAAPSELERLEGLRKQRTMRCEADRKRNEAEMSEIIRKRFLERVKLNRGNKEPLK